MLKKLLLAAVIAAAFLVAAPTARAQATTQVYPRQYVLWSGLLTPKQAITTNAALPGQNIGVFTNTFIPFSGAHAIGLSGTITTTNALQGASNVVTTVYPAYDLGGGSSSSIFGRYGTSFATAPILTWTQNYTTNALIDTNLTTAQWEPATSLGFTISNGCNSNTFYQLVMTVTP